MQRTDGRLNRSELSEIENRGDRFELAGPSNGILEAIRAHLDPLAYHFGIEVKRLRNELPPVGNIVGGNTIPTVSTARRHFPSCFRGNFSRGT